MRRTKESPPQAGQVSPETYKVGTQVVVNLDGDWKVGVLQQDTTINPNGKLAMRVAVDGTDHDFLYDMGDGPEVVAGIALMQNGIIDGSEQYTITNIDGAVVPSVSPEGHVEYTVTGPDGRVYNHVAQELLLSWKKTLELEARVQALYHQVVSLAEDKRIELGSKRVALEKQVGEVYQHLPEVQDMQDADRSSVDRLSKTIAVLHTRIEKELDVFEKEVAEIKPQTSEEQESLRDFTFFEKESAADKKLRETRERELHKENQALASQLLQEIRVINDSVETDIEKERSKYLEDLVDVEVDKKRNEYNDAVAEYNTKKAAYDVEKTAYDAAKPQNDRAWQEYDERKKDYDFDLREWGKKNDEHRRTAGRSPDPGPRPVPPALPVARLEVPIEPRKPDMLNTHFDEHRAEQEARGTARVDRQKTKDLKDKKETTLIAEKKAIIDAISDSAASTDKKRIWQEVNRRRLAFARRATKNLNASGTDLDNTGDDSPWHRKNIDILEQVLTEYGGEYEFTEQTLPDERTEKIFDWKKEREKLLERIRHVEEKVGDTPPKDPVLRAIYDEVKHMAQDVQASYAMLEDLEKADALLGTGPKTIEALNGLRLDNLQDDTEKINGLAYRFDLYQGTKKEEERTKAEQKEISDHQKAVDDVAETHEFIREGIDIPDHELREMLSQNVGSVRLAMEALMRGGITRSENNNLIISPDLLKKVQSIFGEHPPAGMGQKKLRSWGIKSWDTFKKLWDTELSSKALIILDNMITQSLERKIAENTSMWEKMKAHKERIVSRAFLNSTLLYGGTIGAHQLVSLVSEMGAGTIAGSLTGAVAGGTATGSAKWAAFKSFFGRDSAKKKMAERESVLHSTKKEEIIASVLSDMFEGSTASGTLVPNKKNVLTGFDAIGRLFSHAIRETSTNTETFTLVDGNTFEMTGSDLLAYKHHLASIDKRNIDDATKAQLAWAVLKMRHKDGDVLSGGSPDNVTQKPSLMDKFMTKISGQESWKSAVGTNIALTGLVAVNPVVRSGFGALVMGRVAMGMGEQLFYKSERRGAEQRVDAKMKFVVEHLDMLRQHKRAMGGDTYPDRVVLRQAVVDLKRILHGTAPPEDMSAVVYRVAQKGVDDAGNPLSPKVQLDSMRLMNIESLVYEVEREHIFHEEEKQRAVLAHVLGMVQKTGDMVAEEQTERNPVLRKMKKGVMMYGSAMLGAVVGAGIGYSARTVAQAVGDSADFYSEKLGFTDTGDIYNGPDRFGVLPTDFKPVAVAGGVGAMGYSMSAEHPAVLDGHESVQHASTETDVAEVPVIKSPDIVASSQGLEEIHKGEGPLHAINRLADAKELHMTKQEFRDWKMEELNRMGIINKGGKWGWPFTVHAGAKVEMYTGTDGEPHVRLIAEEGKTITSHGSYQWHGGIKNLDTISDEVSHTADMSDANHQNPKMDKNSPEWTKNYTRLQDAIQKNGPISNIGDERVDGRVPVTVGAGGTERNLLVPKDIVTDIVHGEVGNATSVNDRILGMTLGDGGRIGSGASSMSPESIPTVGADVPEGKRFFVTPAEVRAGESVRDGGATVHNLADHRATSGRASEGGLQKEPAKIIPLRETPASAGGAVPEAANDTLFGMPVMSLERSPLSTLDEQGVIGDVFRSVRSHIGAMQGDVPPEIRDIIAERTLDPVEATRAMADYLYTHGEMPNLSMAQRLFIGGDDVFNNPTEFVKVQISMQDSSGYIGHAYLPIGEGGSPASKFVGIQFPDDRGYRFISSDSTVFTSTVDENGVQVLRMIDTTGDVPVSKIVELAA